MVYKCKGCNSSICVDCKQYYGWEGGKTLRQCSICVDYRRKKQILRLNKDQTTSRNKGVSVEEDNMDDAVMDIDIRKLYSSYDQKRKYKAKKRSRSKMRVSQGYHRRKIDKSSNIKQRIRFNKRYALSFQY